MSEDTSVRPADGSAGAARSLEVCGSEDLHSLHLGAGSLLFDVLNREFATRGLYLSKAV